MLIFTKWGFTNTTKLANNFVDDSGFKRKVVIEIFWTKGTQTNHRFQLQFSCDFSIKFFGIQITRKMTQHFYSISIILYWYFLSPVYPLFDGEKVNFLRKIVINRYYVRLMRQNSMFVSKEEKKASLRDFTMLSKSNFSVISFNIFSIDVLWVRLIRYHQIKYIM